jgi:hypothetical protein
MLPHKVNIKETGESVSMTPELRNKAGERCANALVRWATGAVMKDLGIG